MKKEVKMGILNYIALLSIFIFSGAGTYENSAIQSMIDAWPNIASATIRMVVTLPSLVSLPAMLIIGGIVGKKISYRLSAIIGTALIMIGGAGPFFISSSWSVVIAFRVLLGIGVGVLGMRNPLIYGIVPKEKQAQMIGYGSVLMTAGTTVASPIVGFLTQFSWKHAFLFNGLAVIPLILIILFLKEPAKEMEAEEEIDLEAGDSAQAKSKSGVAGFTWKTWYYIVMAFLTTAAIFPLQSGLTTLMADKGIGTVVIAGTMISAYNLAGTIVNLIISPLMKVFKQYLIGVACVCGAAGSALVVFVPSIPVMFAGMVLAGIGFCCMLCLFQIYNGSTASPGSVAFASTVILSMLYFGIFASSYFISGCHAVLGRGTDAESAMIGGAVVYAVLAIIAFVLKIAPDEYYQGEKEQ